LPANGSVFVLFRKPAQADSGHGQPNDPDWKPVHTVDGPWTVRFDPQWGPKEPVPFPQLISWTEHPDSEVKYYSGAATYRGRFHLSGNGQGRVRLDLGQLRNLAEVRLNGKDLGVLWTTPFAVDVTEAIQPGANDLEITVVNLWPNRLIGDQLLPLEKRRTRTNITKFEDKKNQELLPSGLFGPVTLQRAM